MGREGECEREGIAGVVWLEYTCRIGEYSYQATQHSLMEAIKCIYMTYNVDTSHPSPKIKEFPVRLEQG